MTTDRQIEANRRNAQLATGPRTSEGRAISSQNSVRHGVLSENVIISSENPDHYYDLLEALWHEVDPHGEREAIFVERLANLFWRERRLIQSEREALEIQNGSALDPFTGGLRSLSLGQQLLIGRYQTMLTNQISATLSQIEKLQASRIGS